MFVEGAGLCSLYLIRSVYVRIGQSRAAYVQYEAECYETGRVREVGRPYMIWGWCHVMKAVMAQ